MDLPPEWLTLEEAQALARCKKTRLYKALAFGEIEARRAFGRTLFNRASIMAYIDSCPRVGRRGRD